LIRLMLPPVLLVALKLPTVLAPPRVVPPTELVGSGARGVARLAPVSLRVPLATRLMAPPLPAETVPVRLMAPVLLTVTLPPPLWLMPVMVSGAAVLIRLMLPPVLLVALKLPTALAPPRVVPPTELV